LPDDPAADDAVDADITRAVSIAVTVLASR